MKVILPLFILMSGLYGLKNMESFDYESHWNEVKTLEQKALYKSCLEKIGEIELHARNEGDEDQLIKVFIHRLKYSQYLAEYSTTKELIAFDQSLEALKSNYASKLGRSLAAEAYYNYASNNMYQLSSKTSFEDTPDDIEDWSLNDFYKHADQLYLESIESIESLIDVDLKMIEILLADTPKRKYLLQAENLFEFLHFRAARYFADGHAQLTKVVSSFDVNRKVYFEQIESFIQLQLPAQGQLDPEVKALSLFQKLLSYYKDKDELKLAALNIKRLNFLMSRSNLEKANEWAIKAVEKALEQSEGEDAKAIYAIYLAKKYIDNQHYNKQEYKGFTRGNYKNALALIEAYQSKLTEEDYKELIQKINNVELEVQTEEMVLPDEYSKIYVKYRNIPALHFKLAKVSETDLKTINGVYDRNERYKIISSLDFFKSWKVDLPKGDDLDPHAVELPINVLPTGNYVLLSSNDPQFQFSKSKTVSCNIFGVSKLAVMVHSDNVHTQIVVVDRKTGQPIQDAQVDIYTENYNQSRRKSMDLLLVSGKTDKDGSYWYNEENRRFKIKVSNGEDAYSSSMNFGNYQLQRSPEYTQIYTFTDRAIYRPGQVINYKSLISQKDENEIPTILTNTEVIVNLRDANYQLVEEQKLRSNEFGTVDGSFTIPTNLLNGRFQIEISAREASGFHDVKVEEYKRPSFKVNFEDLDEAYKLGDKVKVKGIVQTYSGVKLKDVEVEYKVNKSNFVFYGCGFYRPYFPYYNQSELVSYGATLTDAEGAFEIYFQSYEEANNWLRSNYTIELTARDERGETQSGNRQIMLSNDALYIDLKLQDYLIKDELTLLRVLANNSEGRSIDFEGAYQISKLKGIDRRYNKNYWGYTDQRYMDRSYFDKYFPKYVWDDELLNPENWETTKSFKKVNLNTKQNQIDLAGLPAGTYRLSIELNDANGNVVNEQRFFNVLDEQSNQNPIFRGIQITKAPSEIEPNAKIDFELWISDDNAYVFQTTKRMQNKSRQDWLTVKQREEVLVEINERDRGGVFLDFWSISDNRLIQESLRINVPWSNKVLELEIENFRDKVRPGEQESYKVRVKSEDDLKATELMATMYDKSLDVFANHSWNTNFFPRLRPNGYWRSMAFAATHGQIIRNYERRHYDRVRDDFLPNFNWFGARVGGYMGVMNKWASKSAGLNPRMQKMAAPMTMEDSAEPSTEMENLSADVEMIEEHDQINIDKNLKDKSQSEHFSIRENLDELVFYYPNLQTDENGWVNIDFKHNEALTEWSLMLFAHDQEFRSGYITQSVVTSKDLMITGYVPRFLRQGDQMVFKATVYNQSESNILPNSKLVIENAITGEDVTAQFGVEKMTNEDSITVANSEVVEWGIKVPIDWTLPVITKFISVSGLYTDGEQYMLPVIPNRKLVNESTAFYLNGNESKLLDLEFLDVFEKSSTAQPQHLVLEITTNPIWLAIKSMPFIKAHSIESSTHLAQRLYVAALGKQIINDHPQIENVFQTWLKNEDALKSTLAKNEEFKNEVLNATPWVNEALSEAEQMRNIALYFDENNLNNELNYVWRQLTKLQSDNGGFVWIGGGRPHLYTTQRVLTLLGHLKQLGVNLDMFDNVKAVQSKAIQFIDQELIALDKKDRLYGKDYINHSAIQYLYTRSFYDEEYFKGISTIIDNLYEKVTDYWSAKSSSIQAMIALAALRDDRRNITDEIMASFKERAIEREDLGVFWKQHNIRYNWSNNEIESQAIMIELFSEMKVDPTYINKMKQYLLKHKQVNRWENNQSAAFAIYALLLNNEEWSRQEQSPEIKWGDLTIQPNELEAGTGYFKYTVSLNSDLKSLKKLSITNTNNTVMWGAVHLQYFEDLDQIEIHEVPGLSISKDHFIKRTNDSGTYLEPLVEGQGLLLGDEIVVRIEINNDRPMEFIHLKDMRAAGSEPTSTLSQYQYQSGLYYYQTSKDLHTSFFIDYLPKGNFVFEYSLRASHEGAFSNGIAEIQSYYAPEFGNHTEGIRLNIE